LQFAARWITIFPFAECINLYAIIEDSGQQLRVSENETIEIDVRDLPEGTQTIEFDRVLLIGDLSGETRIGQPWVEGAKVIARLQGEVKGDKIHVIKFRRRKGYRRKQGHRQKYLRVTVEEIRA
jgi:large subunit ribosomal protein L21